MKANGMLCRSHESTAVCIPCDARTMITTTRRAADRKIIENSRHLVDFKYSRLPDSRRFGPGHDRRRSAVTLPMLTKKEISREQPKPNNANVVLPPLEPVSTADHVFQVVVMRVAIHCQGCAGKVRKHISKMEGVTSFSIDLDTKRVTVMGHVSPMGVLESISKVKKAEFWPADHQLIN
ncbi:heavy metal-associated isoprenylated plant protein 5-like [Ananas comosus]|uniref:Heavy metal-associated isoprenylated plant protein 5-like n=2 Tax=Ananas comosus TaxID=4615 RepID=A0A6P5EEU5_ANACO|nr:heavy metal-associated isoprenylated plant protein 5-like [Ananas comosus]CAD1826376.1 unnamed protein product [Ananas comosus var. bracteatus]